MCKINRSHYRPDLSNTTPNARPSQSVHNQGGRVPVSKGKGTFLQRHAVHPAQRANLNSINTVSYDTTNTYKYVPLGAMPLSAKNQN